MESYGSPFFCNKFFLYNENLKGGIKMLELLMAIAIICFLWEYFGASKKR